MSERLEKIYTLILRGTPGESYAAEHLLGKILATQGLTIKDYEASRDLYALIDCEYTYRNLSEKKLLLQIHHMVTEESDEIYRTRNKRGLLFRITLSQKIEIDIHYYKLREALKEEQKIFYEAFINKHRLFSTRGMKGHQDKEPPSYEERARRKKIGALAEFMNPVDIHTQIGETQ